jgi:hypothetical protein
VALVLDTGALIAIDRGDREVFALIEGAIRRQLPIRTSSGCIAQAWRSGGPRQANLSRVLNGVDEVGLDEAVSKAVGSLCAKAKSTDVVDAHVAVIVDTGDVLLTSDEGDLKVLVQAQRKRVEIVGC